MNIPVQPLGDKLIVEVISKEDTRIGKIHVGESDLEKGRVIAVSEKITDAIKKDEIIYFPEGKRQGIVIDGKPCSWLALNDVWGIERKEEFKKDKGDLL